MIKRILVILFLVTQLFLTPAVQAQELTYFAPSISSDTNILNGSSNAYTLGTGPIIMETAPGQISSGTLILNTPGNYVFNPNSQVSVLITGDNDPAKNINGVGSGTSIPVTTLTTTQASITITKTSQNGTPNTLTFQGLQIRPGSGNLMMNNTFQLYFTGSSINGTNITNTFIKQVPGKPVTFIGFANDTFVTHSGEPFKVQVFARDAYNNFANVISDTQFVLAMKQGTGQILGTLSGFIPAGSTNGTVPSVTYTVAELNILLSITAPNDPQFSPGEVLFSSLQGTTPIDTTPPTGTFTINEGAKYTNSNSVSLKFSNTSSDTSQVQLRNGSTGGFQSPIAFQNIIPYVLPEGEGNHTLSARLIDQTGNVGSSIVTSIITDTIAPVVSNILASQVGQNLQLSASIADANKIDMTINDISADLTAFGSLSAVLPTSFNTQTGVATWADVLINTLVSSAALTIKAFDRAGNASAVTGLTVVLATPTPSPTPSPSASPSPSPTPSSSPNMSPAPVPSSSPSPSPVTTISNNPAIINPTVTSEVSNVEPIVMYSPTEQVLGIQKTNPGLIEEVLVFWQKAWIMILDMITSRVLSLFGI